MQSLPAPRAAAWAQRVWEQGRLLPAALGIEEPLGLRCVPEKAVRALERRWDAHAARFALEPPGTPLSAASRRFVEYALHRHVPVDAWRGDLGALFGRCSDDTLRLLHGAALLFDFFREEQAVFSETHPGTGDETLVHDFFHERTYHCASSGVIGLHLLQRAHGMQYGVLTVPRHTVIAVPYRDGSAAFYANNAFDLLPPYFFQRPSRTARDGYVRLGKERVEPSWQVLGHIYNNAAVASWRRGELRLGLSMIRQALGIVPNAAHVWVNAHLFMLGDPGQAQACLREALSINSNDPRAHYHFARRLYDQGSNAAAKAHCQTAIKHEPTYAEAHYLLGLIFLRTGRQAAARARFQRVLELQPEHEGAQQALQDWPRRSVGR